jgi:hypothetical protein
MKQMERLGVHEPYRRGSHGKANSFFYYFLQTVTDR